MLTPDGRTASVDCNPSEGTIGGVRQLVVSGDEQRKRRYVSGQRSM